MPDRFTAFAAEAADRLSATWPDIWPALLAVLAICAVFAAIDAIFGA